MESLDFIYPSNNSSSLQSSSLLLLLFICLRCMRWYFFRCHPLFQIYQNYKLFSIEWLIYNINKYCAPVFVFFFSIFSQFIHFKQMASARWILICRWCLFLPWRANERAWSMLNRDYFSDTWPLEIEIHRLNLTADVADDDDAISPPAMYCSEPKPTDSPPEWIYHFVAIFQLLNSI